MARTASDARRGTTAVCNTLGRSICPTRPLRRRNYSPCGTVSPPILTGTAASASQSSQPCHCHECTHASRARTLAPHRTVVKIAPKGQGGRAEQASEGTSEDPRPQPAQLERAEESQTRVCTGRNLSQFVRVTKCDHRLPSLGLRAVTGLPCRHTKACSFLGTAVEPQRLQASRQMPRKLVAYFAAFGIRPCDCRIFGTVSISIQVRALAMQLVRIAGQDVARHGDRPGGWIESRTWKKDAGARPRALHAQSEPHPPCGERSPRLPSATLLN